MIIRVTDENANSNKYCGYSKHPNVDVPKTPDHNNRGNYTMYSNGNICKHDNKKAVVTTRVLKRQMYRYREGMNSRRTTEW